jgi:hypothetical protein
VSVIVPRAVIFISSATLALLARVFFFAIVVINILRYTVNDCIFISRGEATSQTEIIK